MSTDRELLELAAKAAGFKFWRSKHGHWHVESPDGESGEYCIGRQRFNAWSGEEFPESTIEDALTEYGWFPLTDDDDALRLAVKLRFNVDVHSSYTYCCSDDEKEILEQHCDSDMYAATRRAIVRAAAEIGKAMP